MLESEIKVINPLGLHARAAAQLVRLAVRFQSEVKLRRADNEVIADAKSILSVLSLAAAKDTELSLRIEGEDESEATEAIKAIFVAGFGEI